MNFLINEKEYSLTDVKKLTNYNVSDIAIGRNAFAHKDIESITIPDGIERIEAGAFLGCKNLKQVNIPKTVKNIELAAFALSGIEELIIPEGITEIREFLCMKCNNLKRVVLPKSTDRLCFRSFMGCKSLQEIIIPEKVTLVGARSFEDCKALKSVVIKNSDCIVSTL